MLQKISVGNNNEPDEKISNFNMNSMMVRNLFINFFPSQISLSFCWKAGHMGMYIIVDETDNLTKEKISTIRSFLFSTYIYLCIHDERRKEAEALLKPLWSGNHLPFCWLIMHIIRKILNHVSNHEKDSLRIISEILTDHYWNEYPNCLVVEFLGSIPIRSFVCLCLFECL